MEATGRKPFTGRHVLISLIAFFGVMLVANFALLYFALTSWSGLEVPSSYEAGQVFNEELAVAHQQEARGWKMDVAADRASDGTVAVRLTARDKFGQALQNLSFTGRFSRPVKRADDVTFAMEETVPGTYEATVADVGPGQWDIIVEANENGERVFRSRNRVVYQP
ncbi:FixH family protein [Rhodobium gokarnense]|uniref:Nitrogen fixation protein FixH n=1 Tax=Rhodobium gokarnense TaxID=364296 RepID=A0ABT3H7V2_9HYPH|nr:FixH family protein [Rhodobium gokarnense]MCW2306468.1 nitrogen fixation protein FixH [Rhodobium gokarnense]